MKKCPTCEKTFDDNLRFCQTDGTALVAADEEPALDPLKTMIASQSDLPGFPDDPLKTVVADEPLAEEIEARNIENVLDLDEQSEPIDPMKTILASDFKGLSEESRTEAGDAEPTADKPPPSPFSEPDAEQDTAEAIPAKFSPASPEPPRFSEPDITPPDFGNSPESSAVEPESAPSAVDESPVQDGTDADAISAAETGSQSEGQAVADNDFSGASPFGDAENVPIPSPFGETAPSTYQPPATPMPAFQQPQDSPPQFSPFDQPAGDDQAMEWNAPPPPISGWQDQQIGQNTPFQPPPAGVTGQDQTLSIVSLVLGIVSIVFCLGFVSGIPALITGYMARKRIDEAPSVYGGGTMAMVGMILGGVGAALSLLSIAAWIFLVVLTQV